MGKRLFDVFVATLLLTLTFPIWIVTGLAIRLCSPGPVLHRAIRMGRGATPFVMYKFRTMHLTSNSAGSSITGASDTRVYPLGRLLRLLKIDELPQLINILLGHMSFCGPRPEAVDIVEKYYQPWQMTTLSVRPGLVSPGSLFNYTHGEQLLAGTSVEQAYVQQLLPLKLAIELVYLRHICWSYDVRLMIRTAITILAKGCGRRTFPPPPELPAAEMLLAAQGDYWSQGCKRAG